MLVVGKHVSHFCLLWFSPSNVNQAKLPKHERANGPPCVLRDLSSWMLFMSHACPCEQASRAGHGNPKPFFIHAKPLSTDLARPKFEKLCCGLKTCPPCAWPVCQAKLGLAFELCSCRAPWIAPCPTYLRAFPPPPPPSVFVVVLSPSFFPFFVFLPRLFFDLGLVGSWAA